MLAEITETRMTKQPKYHILNEKLFLYGLVVLILNDFYLKYAFSNFLTGKLSDFTGLFLFPYFVSIFFEKHARKVYFLVGTFFIFWKLEISEPFINWISALTDIAFYRTVDYTDLIALMILPISYNYFRMKSNATEKTTHLCSPAIGMLSVLIFVADSNPTQSIGLNFASDKKYKIARNKDAMFLKSFFRQKSYNGSPDSVHFSFLYDIPEYNAQVTAKTTVGQVTQNTTMLKLDSITEIKIHGRLFFGVKQSDVDHCKNLKQGDLERYFKLNCLNHLNSEINPIEKPYQVYYSNEYK